MKVCVVGCGAVGSLFAAHLAKVAVDPETGEVRVLDYLAAHGGRLPAAMAELRVPDRLLRHPTAVVPLPLNGSSTRSPGFEPHSTSWRRTRSGFWVG